MSRDLLWKIEIEDWANISVESYQFVIQQAKERLDEVINEWHRITSWGMKVLLSYVAGLSGLAGYAYSENNNEKSDFLSILIVAIAAIFSAYVFTLLFALISTRNKFYKGSPPKEIFFEDVFKDLLPGSGFKALLYNEVERVQDKIDQIQMNNKRRISQYRAVLKISLILVALAIFAIAKKVLSGS